ncbi:MAG: hypothetical protein PHO83_13815 [Geobacteraceae bacterium]|nr:hypothetical protein [Geobacteraceae bacterium]
MARVEEVAVRMAAVEEAAGWAVRLPPARAATVFAQPVDTGSPMSEECPARRGSARNALPR